MRHSSFPCCVLLILGALATHANTANYRFVNIADTRGAFDSFDLVTQAVSESGTVAFIGHQGGAAGSYVGNGNSITPILQNLAPPTGFNGGIQAVHESGLAIGDASRCCPTDYRVLLYEQSGTRMIGEEISSASVFRTVVGRDINDAGAVAMIHSAFTSGSPGSEQRSITTWFNGTTTVVLDTMEGFKNVDLVALNEQGNVAFHGWKQDGTGGYYRTDGTTLTTIADASGPLDIPGALQGSQFTGLAMNDSGDVAFRSRLDAGGEGIFVGDGGPLTTVAIADPTTPFFDLMWNHSIDINNEGTVAFFAGLWDGRNGIFTGPDPVNDKVVAHGDLLFGQFVDGLGRPHLNKRGDIAFWYRVRDPREPDGERTGIAVAIKEQPLSGDYNGDGGVDAADYVAWRKYDGTQQGYDAWRTNFGATAAGAAAVVASGATGSASAVPEPATLLLLASVSAIALLNFRCHCVTKVCGPSRTAGNSDEPKNAC